MVPVDDKGASDDQESTESSLISLKSNQTAVLMKSVLEQA
jgi:hypothetical protein